jgi:hypothetical protein
MKMCRENPDVVKIGQKYLSGTLHEHLSTSYCCCRQICHNSIVVQHCIFVLSAVTWNVTMYVVRIVSFPLQQWILERAPVLLNTYIAACLVLFSARAWSREVVYMFGTGRAEKRVETHFTRWHESFIRGFLNWIVQCMNTCVCVCVWTLCRREVVGWLLEWQSK